jgi:hypothetical protein
VQFATGKNVAFFGTWKKKTDQQQSLSLDVWDLKERKKITLPSSKTCVVENTSKINRKK